MGKHVANGATRRAAGSVVAAGAVPLIAALIGAGTAEAEVLPAPPAPPAVPALPVHLFPPTPGPAVDPFQAAVTAVQEATRGAVQSATDTITAATAPYTHPVPAVPAVAAPPLVADPAPGTRPVPEYTYLAPQGALHAPVPVTPVAPIEAPPGTLRIGNLTMTVPFDAREVNQGAAQTEAQLATFLDSVGVERSRSDRIAAQTMGSALVGAAIGTAVATPVAIPFAMLGAAAGFVAGIPFLPTGLVIGPVLGATIGYGVVAVPAVIAGAALGAAFGATDGFTAQPFGPVPQ
ncbi:hypothetical protein [Nocardia sp. NBC_00416]|uniref:hypothetical protein n=1 Tax=Nocardia sp. NBC_00416 TaxID=2975991 RepID=UPI002E1B6950